jgi:preprotein translocase subunit SecA
MHYNLAESQEQIPHVLAAIFAWWTMEFYLTLRKRNPEMQVDTAKLRHANNGQVVCLLRLLGATGGSFVNLVNHLAEVPTGEGKSVILGVLATTLALYGYHVDCVCYSSMLSQRDHGDFAPMFKAFGIVHQVRYGTFDTLSELLITEKYGDLRQAARDYIAGASSGPKGEQNPPARVLVIDEVDVFCSEAFFGGAYCPQLELKNDQIANLMRHIWSIRSAKLDLISLKGHPAYQGVMSSGALTKQSEWLLDRSVQQMHIAAKAFVPNMHEFKIEHGCILYKVEGRDDYARWSYGYETNAEYLHAFEIGKLTDAQLVQGLALHVRCGEFAFAKLPRAFKHILGVTGTLDKSKLPPQMLEVLKTEVQIEEFTYCPSMYHAQKRDFEPSSRAYVQLAKDEDEHFNMIADEVDLRLKPTVITMEGARSVIVFFRDEKELQRFRSSSYFKPHLNTAQVLTELTAARREDRDSIVNKATRQGMVTLASRMYGRGTDFKIFDERMEVCGGLHVLQTFFSADLSEEVQIQGRCARQGNRGSYSLVLHATSLAQQFDEKDETIVGWPAESVYANLVKLRERHTAGEMQSLRELAAKRKGEHRILQDALKASSGGKVGAMEQVMRRYNTASGLVMGGNGLHVIFCLDESYSMEGSDWSELVGAFNRFWQTRVAALDTMMPEHASVVQFSDKARVTHEMRAVTGSAPSIDFGGGGTAFVPPITHVKKLVKKSGPDQGYTVVVVFMSDGAAPDAAGAAGSLQKLAQEHQNQFACYTVGFGSGASQTLQAMAFSNGVQENGNYRTADIGSLGEAFAMVAASIVPGRV